MVAHWGELDTDTQTHSRTPDRHRVGGGGRTFKREEAKLKGRERRRVGRQDENDRKGGKKRKQKKKNIYC